MPHDRSIPSEAQIYAWIETVFARGIRRPGYAADRWAETWLEAQLRELGLENVRREWVNLPYWDPVEWSLTATQQSGDAKPLSVECFPLPHAAPTAPLDAPLVRFDPANPEQVRGAVALRDVPLMRIPQLGTAGLAT